MEFQLARNMERICQDTNLYINSIVFDRMAIIQVLPVLTSAAKPARDDIASLFWKHVFCISNGIPAREKHGEDMSRHKSVHKQGKMHMPVWKSSLVSGSFKGELTKFYTLYLAEHWNGTNALAG